MKHRVVLAAALLVTACAEQPVTRDTAQWRPYKNADGRDLLAHTSIDKCYVDLRPPQDFNQPGFTVKREQKTIRATRYDIANVYEGRDFWMSVYRAAGSPTPLLGVYAQGRCREAAESMLEVVEKRKGPA